MKRMHHLDALRSFCMLYGVFFHAHEIVSFWLSDLILAVSGYFRMATFFFVSAFLTAMLFEKRSIAATLQSRLIALGVPLIVSFLTLVPLAKWGQFSIAVLPEGSESLPRIFWGLVTFQLKGAYLHLWFLIALILYLVTAPFIYTLMRLVLLFNWSRRCIGSIHESVRLLVLAVFVGLGCAISMSIFHVALPERAYSSVLVNGVFFNYPFYIMGIGAYVAYDEFQRIIKLDKLALASCFLIVVFLHYQNDNISEKAAWFLKGLVNCVVAVTLTASFSMIFRSPGPKLSFLTRTIYSVYLSHYTFIYCFGYLFVIIGFTGGLLYMVTVVASIVGSLAFHYLVVEHSSVTKLIYNGRWEPVSSPTRQQSSTMISS